MRGLFRKFLILIAAYALALQPAFAGMSAAHAQAAVEFCAAGRGGDAPVPTGKHKDSECCLATGCSAPAGADAVASANVVPAFNVSVAPADATQPAFFIEWPNERPHSARAPPV
jgi:hypothetical protein